MILFEGRSFWIVLTNEVARAAADAKWHHFYSYRFVPSSCNKSVSIDFSCPTLAIGANLPT
jgi:hypothetical protein